jgi:hypothetical protein
MRILITVSKESHDVFRFEAPLHKDFDLAEIVELAFDEFATQHPQVSLTDPEVHFAIRDLKEPSPT